jgi:hypothetical protein
LLLHLRFAFSSFSSSSYPTTRRHQHHTITMHQSSASSSSSSLASRPSPDMHLLLINSMCSAFGTSSHLTHSYVHSCLPSHAGSLNAPTTQDSSRTLVVSSALRDASVIDISDLRTTGSRGLIDGNAGHQPPCQPQGSAIISARCHFIPFHHGLKMCTASGKCPRV